MINEMISDHNNHKHDHDGEDGNEGGLTGSETQEWTACWGRSTDSLETYTGESLTVFPGICPPPEGVVGVRAGLAGHHLAHVPGGGGGGGRGGDGGHRGGGQAPPGCAQVVLAVKALHPQLGHLVITDDIDLQL